MPSVLGPVSTLRRYLPPGTFDFDFTKGGPLDPLFTFSRAGETTYVENGELRRADSDNPVITPEGIRLWAFVTNWALGDWNYSNPFKSQIELDGTFGDDFPEYKYTDAGDGDGSAYAGGLSNEASLLEDDVVYMSFVLRPGSTNRLKLWFRHYSGGAALPGRYSVTCNAEGNGSFSQQNVNIFDESVEKLAGGRYRFTCAARAPSGVDAFNLQIATYDSDNGAHAFVSCPSVVRRQPGPYVPTSNSAASKPGSNLKISGAALESIFNGLSGAVVADVVSYPGNISNQWPVIFRMAGIDANDRYWIYRRRVDDQLRIVGQSGGNTVIPEAFIYQMSGGQERIKFAFAWEGDEIKFFLNGNLVPDGSKSGIDMTRIVSLSFADSSSNVGNPSSPNVYKRVRVLGTKPSDAQMKEWTS